MTTTPFVIATVKNAKGSTPRENGAYMLISQCSTRGTIGGGKLEFEVIHEARRLLSDSYEKLSSPGMEACDFHSNHEQPAILQQQDFILGTQLGQCCGGQLSIDYSLCHDAARWIDPEISAQTLFNIVLFGAGHVGQAIINILATQACQVYWIDSRKDLFPPLPPNNVTTFYPDQPASLVTDMPAHSYYLVMTHDHGLDLELCDHILSRHDIAFLGLIGSQTKAMRFKRQLLRRGLNPDDIAKLTCPIGIDSISAKLPSSIALAAVAQLVGLHEKHQPESATQPTDHSFICEALL